MGLITTNSEGSCMRKLSSCIFMRICLDQNKNKGVILIHSQRLPRCVALTLFPSSGSFTYCSIKPASERLMINLWQTVAKLCRLFVIEAHVDFGRGRADVSVEMNTVSPDPAAAPSLTREVTNCITPPWRWSSSADTRIRSL
jgi:hypothetical protein